MKGSIKIRITVWYSIILLIVSLSLLFLTVNISNSIMMHDLKNRLIESVEGFTLNVKQTPNFTIVIPEHKLNENGIMLCVYSKSGEEIFGWTPIDNNVKIKESSIELVVKDGKEYYVYDTNYIRTGLNGDIRIRGVTCLTDALVVIQDLLIYYLILVVLVILIASIGGYMIINKALEPVNKIRLTAKEISESKDLSQRINLKDTKDEISNLAKTFDGMLDKLEDNMLKEKQFTSDVSHELRTPIAVILSECEYGSDCVEDIEEMRGIVDSVKSQASKMSKLVTELLMISRMDNDRIQINIENVDISELLNFVCDEQEEIHNSKTILIRNIENNVYYSVDVLLMTRLFVNILSNAYQYIGNGNMIIVSLKEFKDNFIISIKDNGIGISKENQSKIWNRFYQVDSSRTSSENSSSGLGLSMVKWIAEKHNINIELESELGKGSEFKLIFPKIN